MTRLEAETCWPSVGHIPNNQSVANGVSSMGPRARSTGQPTEGVQVGAAAFGLAQPILTSPGE